jgi:cardiolipin synthase
MDGAELTFSTVLQHIRDARESIEIHMFVWRNDAIGNAIGEAILEAAERGVEIRIIKDLGAFMYERIEMNRKSFFNKPISFSQNLIYKVLGPSFPDTYCEDDYTDELGTRIMEHPKVTMEWVNHTHTKYYIFDNKVMVTGSINIEDRHRGYYDYMIRIEGEEEIARFRERKQLAQPYDPGRSLDFVVNRLDGGAKTFEIKDAFLRLMEQAQHSAYIEMAYIGDPDISAAIRRMAARGVAVTMLFSREANIGNDINYKSMHELCRGASIDAYLTRKMIHSKLMMVDDAVIIMGSANFSVFSMQKAEELNVIIQSQPEVVQAFMKTMEQRKAESIRAQSADAFTGYNPRVAVLQQLHQKLNSFFN